MTQSLPLEYSSENNREVIAHIKDLSAHSDVAVALAASIAPLGDAQIFCPNRSKYRYVLVSTKKIIFGFAIGMDTVVFRLDSHMKERALISGASDYQACGANWVSFTLFRDNWPTVDLDFWALKAYVIAREISK